MKPRNWAIAPDETTVIGYGGAWDLPVPAPRTLGVPRKSDWCTGLLIGADMFVERIRPLGPGTALETLDALVQRAALQHGTTEEYRFVYADGPQV